VVTDAAETAFIPAAYATSSGSTIQPRGMPSGTYFKKSLSLSLPCVKGISTKVGATALTGTFYGAHSSAKVPVN